MTVTKGLALIFSVMVAGALIEASSPPIGAATTAGVRLKAITSRVGSKGASLVIEASEPVPYIATRPDPLTVLIDVHNAAAEGVANSVAASAKSPIAAVVVEPADAASRIRVALTEPVAYHVRAERNTIVVDFAPPAAKPASFGTSASAARSNGAAASRQSVPDAMRALETSAAPVDPVVALGLDQSRGSAPRARFGWAQAAGSTTIEPPVPPQQPPSAPAPSPQPNQIGVARAERKFTGHPISLDFQGADLRAVLRTFAEISGLNVVIDPKVQGTVDVALRDVPWDQALDIILKANSLGYLVDGTIVRIAPMDVLQAEQTKIAELAKAQTEAGQVTTMTKQLSYAKGDEIVSMLTSARILSSKGTAFVDARTNTLVISDLADRLNAASELITTLDKPQPQVEIEARIIATTKDFARALGIQWGFMGRVDPQLGNTTNLAFPNSGTIGGRTGAQQGAGIVGPTPTGVNLPVSGATSAVGLQLGSINGAFNLDTQLSALEHTGNLRILSSPRVSTQNNQEAEITQGQQIPIQTVANNTVTVTFKDAALTLKVTPQITSAGTVIMKISVENASADFGRAVNGIPPIDTQRALTQVLINDGETTVIGGIYKSAESIKNDSTPGLNRIPLLKWLFRRDDLTNSTSELLIFITPRIMRGNG